MSKLKKLNIVDEKDKIIGEETRENIHRHGLLHREVHVWLYNHEGGVLFQKRSLSKDTFPGLLDASVGGHVELNQSYEEAAVQETKEETGILINQKLLTKLGKTRNRNFDKSTGTTNNNFRMVYAYKHEGTTDNLKIEKGRATSLEFWPIRKIMNLSNDDRKKFIPSILNEDFIFRKIKDLIDKK